jgi:two-component system cell cycle sensor histidine kinase PleC
MDETRTIAADRRALMQIMLNVLSNAVKFTRTGGRVSVSCQERHNTMSIRIADTGIGIPPNKLASITRPFEQVSSHYTRDHEGSGLGLAITKELVEMHGGSLQIESALGVGTAVTMRFPYSARKKEKRPLRPS